MMLCGFITSDSYIAYSFLVSFDTFFIEMTQNKF